MIGDILLYGNNLGSPFRLLTGNFWINLQTILLPRYFTT